MEDGNLLRLFSAFPGGWPGLGLLLLRVAVGMVALFLGGSYLSESAASTAGTWFCGMIGSASGAALLIGIGTPIAGVVAGVGAMGLGFSIFPPPALNLFDEKLPAILATIIAAAIVFLGPGAYSLDARLFGRREIIIPPRSRS
jgi:uncharacterized membrane protein YphA (DoxX/SURF4 family)